MSDQGQPDPRQWGPPPSQTSDAGWSGSTVPPSGAAQGYPSPQQQSGQVAVPSWVIGDWAVAAQIALLGQLIMLLGMMLVTVVGVLRQIADIGLDRLDWAASAARPVIELLGLNGAGAGEPLLVTGLLYTYIAYRMVARRYPRTLAVLTADKLRTVAAGFKVGLISAAVLLVIAILLNSFADQLISRSSSVTMTRSIDFTVLVFYTVFVGVLPAFFALLSGARLTLPRFLGLRVSSSAMLRGGGGGARRTLIVGGFSLLAVSTLGSLLDEFADSAGLGDVLGQLLLTVEVLVLQWLDRAILLILGATKFLHDGGYLWYSGAGPEAWMWVALPILAGAFGVGGVAAVKITGPRTQAEAMRSALLVGPFVAIVSLLVAVGWAGQPSIEDIIPVAILLPTLWGSLALGGAWLWASQQGLSSGFVVGDSPRPPAPSSSVPPAGGGWGPPSSSQGQPEPAWPPPAASDSSSRQPDPSVGHSDASEDEDIDLDSLPPPGSSPDGR